MKRRLTRLLVLVFTVLFDGWILTLLLGGLHQSYRQIPPVGYWWCVLATYIVSAIVFAAVSRVKDAS